MAVANGISRGHPPLWLLCTQTPWMPSWHTIATLLPYHTNHHHIIAISYHTIAISCTPLGLLCTQTPCLDAIGAIMAYHCHTLLAIPYYCHTTLAIPHHCHTIPHNCHTILATPHHCHNITTINKSLPYHTTQLPYFAQPPPDCSLLRHTGWHCHTIFATPY